MNDHDRLIQRVNDALLGVDPDKAARARKALADYTPGDGTGALDPDVPTGAGGGREGCARGAGPEAAQTRPRVLLPVHGLGHAARAGRPHHGRRLRGPGRATARRTAREVAATRCRWTSWTMATMRCALDRDGTRTLFSEFARERSRGCSAGRGAVPERLGDRGPVLAPESRPGVGHRSVTGWHDLAKNGIGRVPPRRPSGRLPADVGGSSPPPSTMITQDRRRTIGPPNAR